MNYTFKYKGGERVTRWGRPGQGTLIRRAWDFYFCEPEYIVEWDEPHESDGETEWEGMLDLVEEP